MHIQHSILLALILGTFNRAYSLSLDIRLNEGGSGPLTRFWTSTGFSPTPSTGNISQFLLSHDVELNLALISSVPNRGITHVRIHWLLDLVTAICRENQKWTFDFLNLDKFLAKLYKYKLSIGFEIMGNPSNCFLMWDDWQLKQWTNFIGQLIQRYIDLFGYEYVRSWRIETMNEPDLKMYNRNNMTLKQFISYTITTAQVLQTFDLDLWGPAGLFKNKTSHPLCWGILKYCQTNVCPFKVLSFHKKGNGISSNVVTNSEALIKEIKSILPTSVDLLFANDESDPMTGWIQPLVWRQDARYAASVAQIVIGLTQSAVENKFKLAAVSNDNAFLSYHPHQWSQRTLFARFQMNNTIPPHVQMFQKPVFIVMSLLSKLGPQLIETKYEASAANVGVSFISTSDKKRRSVLVTICNDTLNNNTYSEGAVNLIIRLKLATEGIPGRAVMYIIDNIVTNPEHVWDKAGKPSFPEIEIRRKIRKQEHPKMIVFDVARNDSELNIDRQFVIPSVVLIDVCYENNMDKSKRIVSLIFLRISGNEILFMWDDVNLKSICIKTFFIQTRKGNETQYKIISRGKFITTSYHFDGCIKAKRGRCKFGNIYGEYRVGAIDYWNRKGYYSDPIAVFNNSNNLPFTLGSSSNV